MNFEHFLIPCLIMSAVSFLLATLACILVLAQKFSTHKIEWKPLILDEAKEVEEAKEQELSEEEELQDALDLQKKAKKKKEELKDPLDEILDTNNF